MTTATAIKSKAIIMQDWEVRAIRGGTKTMFRTLVKPQPPPDTDYISAGEDPMGKGALCISRREGGEFPLGVDPWRPCPYTVGMRLWVRETWALRTGSQADHHSRIFYKDGASKLEYWQTGNHVPEKYGYLVDEKTHWRSHLSMPRWASRLTLEVVEMLGPQQVQEISEADAITEGVPHWNGIGGPNASTMFREHWNSRHAKPRPVRRGGKIVWYESFPWKAEHELRKHRGLAWYVHGNCYVWPTRFKVVEQEGAGA